MPVELGNRVAATIQSGNFAIILHPTELGSLSFENNSLENRFDLTSSREYLSIPIQYKYYGYI